MDSLRAEPHIQSIAEIAYQKCFDAGAAGAVPSKQALVITGESGAGKTWNTKKALAYLAKVGKAESVGGKAPVTERMVNSNVILDAFGNSTMPRNDDSSRFGKLFQVFFDRKSRRVTGAMITPYLLEKGRVVRQAHRERNFHAFYALLAGADAGLQGKLHLLPREQYRFLNRFIPAPPEVPVPGKVYESDSVDDRLLYEVEDANRKTTDSSGAPLMDDAGNFNAINAQLIQAGFTTEERELVWEVISAVLLMGNLDVEGGDGSKNMDAPDAKIGNRELLAHIADLLHIPLAKLEAAFTKKTLHGKKVIVTPLNVKNAINAILTFATNIYNGLFVWLVGKISHELKENMSETKDASVAVLDIFGFEFTPVAQLKPPTLMNSFEQFAINACNERLQNHFVNCVLKSEQEVYKKELNGQTVNIDFEDNKATLCVIRKVGELLDDLTRRDREDDTDLALHAKLMREFDQGGSRASSGKASADADALLWMVDSKRGSTKGYHEKEGYGFHLKHYAADVIYDELGWLNKNKGKLSDDINEAFEASSKGGKPTEFPALFFQEWNAENSAKSTVASSFFSALDQLIHELGECHCQFVRCIKSNRAKVGELYEGALVLNQLRYTGMLDTLLIRRKGYPVRMLHAEWMDAYALLNRDSSASPDSLLSFIKTEAFYKASTKGADESIKIGKTMLLMRDGVARALEVARNIKTRESRITIQAAYFASENAKMYHVKRTIATSFGPWIKGCLERKRFRVMYKDKYEKMERVQMQTLIHSTVMRQSYYELKSRHLMVKDKLIQLQEAHKVVASLHQKHIDGLSARLDIENQNLAKERDTVEKAQAEKLSEHHDKLGKMEAENAKLQKFLKAKQDEVSAQTSSLATVREDAGHRQTVLLQASEAADMQWKQRKEEAEELLSNLRKQPSLLKAESDAKIGEMQRELDTAKALHADEADAVVQKHSSVKDEIKEVEEEYARIKGEGAAQAAENKAKLALLMEEMETIDERHEEEKLALTKSLSSQNWKLSQLRLKEAKAEDEFNNLQQHGAIGTVFGAGSQQREVDVLEAKIDQVRYSLKEKSAEYDHKTTMVHNAMRAENEASAAWEVARIDHAKEVEAIKAQIQKEKDSSLDLEATFEKASKTESYVHRPSRFDVQKEADEVLQMPEPEKPQHFPVLPVYDGTTRVFRERRSRFDPRPETLSTTTAATVSSLYQGELRKWPEGGTAAMDASTLRHTLRLL